MNIKEATQVLESNNIKHVWFEQNVSQLNGIEEFINGERLDIHFTNAEILEAIYNANH